ncbi:hypothetical protein GQ600_899 [Phytophthora cactorum]|nr:hypothetical protein GQ600_899 [Phytophthora cactorum]
MAGRMDYNQTNELEPPRSASVEEIVDCFLDEEASMLEFLESCVISTTPRRGNKYTTCNNLQWLVRPHKEFHQLMAA